MDGGRGGARVAVAALLVAGMAGAGGTALAPGRSAAGGDESGSPSNLELVESVAREAVAKLVAGLEPPAPGSRLRIRVEPYHEAGWLVADLASDALRARGLEVVKAAPAAAAPAAAAPAAAPPDTTQAGSAGSAGSGAAASGADSTGQAKPPAPAGGVSGASTPAAAPQPAAEVPVDAELEVRVVELGLRYTGSRRAHFLFGGREVERYAAARLHGDLRRPGDPFVRWSGEGEAALLDEVPAGALPVLEGLRYPFTAPSLPAGKAGRLLEPIIVSAVVIGLVFLFVSNRS